jgi:RNA polymerase sigma-54 factor
MMKPSLQVRLSQHLALTPQLQQSIRLLQLSTLELQQEVEQMLEQNPFLEADEDANHLDTAPSERAASEQAKSDANSGESGERGESDAGNADSGDGESAGLQEVSGTEFGTTEREDWENGTERDDFDGIRETPSTPGSAAGGEDDGGGVERGTAGTSLQDHLRSQMAGMRLTPDDRAALEVLIESLNGDGYLADTLEEIHARLTELFGADDAAARDELMDRLRCALQWLHSMEPLGVGARSLGECLSLQLRAAPRCATQQVALKICDRHLELLARRDFKRLAAATGADEALVKQAQAMIVMCEPKPGRAFEHTETYAVVPDVVVRKSGRGLKVELNQAVMPKLRINDLYAQAVRGARGQSGNHAGLSARLQEARWFMKNIQQRFDTILRVSKAIVERQKNFFTHGAIAMKPLVLREIADELGLHESTISRVTTAKYLASPMGTFELKFFFGSSLNTDAGGNASSTAVRALIKQLVASEDLNKPLSDNQLSQMLDEQGIQVARRTVAKYREALKIAPANLRRAP